MVHILICVSRNGPWPRQYLIFLDDKMHSNKEKGIKG